MKITPQTSAIPNYITPSNTFFKKIFKSDEYVFIVGGGTSIDINIFEKLKGKQVVTINKAMYNTSFARVLYFSDLRFYNWYKDDIEKFDGDVYSIANGIESKKVQHIKQNGRLGLETKDGYIRHGGNSGYAAINLAIQLGAKKIVLLGYDMKSDRTGKTHFHDGYKNTTHDEKIYMKFVESFKSINEYLSKLGVVVYNTSMISELDMFTKTPIEHFL